MNIYIDDEQRHQIEVSMQTILGLLKIAAEPDDAEAPMKQSKHEVKLPTVADHQVGYHLATPVSEWLVAEWGYISAYDTKLISIKDESDLDEDDDVLTQIIVIDTSHHKSYDDNDTPTELWCRDHMVEVRLGTYEIDYE